MNELVTADRTVALPEPPEGWFDYKYAVLMDGSLGLLRTNTDFHAAYAHWRAEFSRGNYNVSRPVLRNERVRLSTFDGIAESQAIEVPSGFAPVLDRMADGRWLVASARSEQNDLNCRVFTPEGEAAGSFRMGDGIAHVRCAPDGTTWVGYFDEGIFPDLNDDGTLSISESGLVQFAADGTVLWSYIDAEDAKGRIDDCDALTLSGNAAWTCFYSDFPIVRIEDGRVQWWSNSVIAGASALAVDDEHVVLAGGYGEESERIALIHLKDWRAAFLGEMKFEPFLGAPHTFCRDWRILCTS